jgi:hypothetical protein
MKSSELRNARHGGNISPCEHCGARIGTFEPCPSGVHRHSSSLTSDTNFDSCPAAKRRGGTHRPGKYGGEWCCESCGARLIIRNS